MPARGLLPGEHVILGLLGLRPMHGYEMARLFAQEDLVTVCPVEQSLLYTYLRNLEERLLVRWEERRVGNRPPRKLYDLTQAGRAELDAWLREPVGRIREIRLDFLLKLYFLHQADPPAERGLIAKQIAVCEGYARALQRSLETLDGFALLVARSKLSAAAATLDWLRSYAAELDLPAQPPQERRVAEPPRS
jgi:DNA-binding PadR family transcriptional regulator